jgi:hypothetical protein
MFGPGNDNNHVKFQRTMNNRKTGRRAPVKTNTFSYCTRLLSPNNGRFTPLNPRPVFLAGPRKPGQRMAFSYLLYLTYNRAFKTRLSYAKICSVEHISFYGRYHASSNYAQTVETAKGRTKSSLKTCSDLHIMIMFCTLSMFKVLCVNSNCGG